MSNDREFQTVVLATLLHDIGKFAQRTGRHIARSHPELSTWFASEFLGKQWQEVVDAVGYHHLPAAGSVRNQRLALTLVLADWLSSGERRELPEGETGEPASDTLISIFSQLVGSNTKTRFPLCALPADGRLEPGADISSNRETYGALWDDFVRECRALCRDDFPKLVDQLLALLEKYTMFVPSAAWKSESDISLYHHLKSTAAIASCIYLAGLDAAVINGILANFESSSRPIAYLVGGDLSGIQDFIYNLRAKGALKGLRGRSLYLQLLPEAVAALVLDEFGLTPCNLLYCSGGHLYVLVPVHNNTESRLADIARRVDRTLLDAHSGRLSVSLAAQALTPADFGREKFGTAWDRLHTRLAREKRRRFSHLFSDPQDQKLILGPTGTGGESPACAVCGEEMTEDAPTADTDKCRTCESFEQLATSLNRATVLTEQRTARGPEKPARWYEVLAALGRTYRFEPATASEGNSFLLNQTDFAEQGLSGFRFLAKHVPQEKGSAAELEDIAQKADGIERWGVLRMDVDNLGNVFKEGLGENRSISRLSVLSYLLGYFFSARVQAIAQEADYRDKIYLAYSGGDDLFAIGAWSVLPVFAERIRTEFGRFTSDRVTLSAGIYLAPSVKFPVYEAADEAGEAESAAKKKGRDRLTFLDTTLTWQELADVQPVKNLLVELLETENGLPKSVLSILRSSWEQLRQAEKGEIPIYPIWRLLYAFKRLKERKEKLALRIDELEHQVVMGTSLRPYLDLIVRWAEYEIRRKNAE